MTKLSILVAALFGMAGAANAQSLLGQGEQASPYDAAKRVDYKKHDHVRIQVIERTRASATADLRTDRRSRWEVALDQWIKFDSKNNKNLPDLKASPLTGNPGIDLEGRFRHDNLGRTTRNSNLTFTITAEVVDIRPNGNLVLQARKRRKINADVETMKLTGEVSPNAIANGVVRSDNVANLDVTYEGDGPVGDVTKPGFLGWLLNKLWPF